jgi:pseudaminic acid biosynthesis-associated methylase
MLTEQEQWWRQSFGDAYVARNRVNWRSRVPFWTSIIDRTKPRSVLEVGCGSGWNMRALRQVDPMLALWGAEINQTALQEAADAGLSVVDSSLFDLKTEWPQGQFDLTFTCGVLIHVSGEDLSRAMDSIISVSSRYVLAVEYADETEVEVPYRGHTERLWRRPFGRLYEQRGLKLVGEGEAPAEAFDACAWWLLERP